MKIGVVILSRFNSSRLPGKALIEIAGKPVLEYIVDRVAQVVDRSYIVIATSDHASDDPIAKFAKSANVACFRGSLDNVAERFVNAATLQHWDYAIRINGDNIFVDVNLLKEMISVTKNNNYLFVSNVKGRTFPKGMSIEIVSVSHFQSLMPEISRSDSYREHVTLIMYEKESDKYNFIINRELPAASGLQMALDTREDLHRTEAIIFGFTRPHWTYNMKEIYEIWKHNVGKPI